MDTNRYKHLTGMWTLMSVISVLTDTRPCISYLFTQSQPEPEAAAENSLKSYHRKRKRVFFNWAQARSRHTEIFLEHILHTNGKWSFVKLKPEFNVVWLQNLSLYLPFLNCENRGSVSCLGCLITLNYIMRNKNSIKISTNPRTVESCLLPKGILW